ncbi:MAG: Na+/H+ antiporter subunit E [candidate division WOR-3 bacterium]|nr:Na+/H+ antiporter subunit E [candidate division WOR-3 bacterium]
MSQRIGYWLLLILLWLILTWTIYYPSLLIGVIIAIIVTIFYGGYFSYQPIKILQPHRLFWLLIYIPVFAWACLKANLDVAYRVIHPEKPLKPGIVKVKTELKTELAKTFLANSITMTPGTMSVDIIDDTLYIHWIWVQEQDIERASKIIVGPFEKYLKNIFE